MTSQSFTSVISVFIIFLFFIFLSVDNVYAQNSDNSALEQIQKTTESSKKILSKIDETLEKGKSVADTAQDKIGKVEDTLGNLGGGCLISTATYGSELAPQVQMLRELRDDSILKTGSGSLFMTGFNEFYYFFSPTIADWERENPVFKEFVKISITPLLSTLSILNYVEIDSEQEMLGYGIGIILLNIGMYFVMPVLVIMKLKKVNANVTM